MPLNAYQQAWHDHKAMLAVSTLYVIGILVEAFLVNVPFSEVRWIALTVAKIFAKCVLFYSIGIAIIFLRAFCKSLIQGKTLTDALQAAMDYLASLIRKYVAGPMIFYAAMSIVVVCAIHFFPIHKSLIRYVNPYHWDPVFAAWDKALHFGRYPHEWLIPPVNSANLSRLDWTYLLWFSVMYGTVAYATLFDSDTVRRLRFLWSLRLTWVILGSLAATAFSSVGPVFYNSYYPDHPDIYRDLLRNFSEEGRLVFIPGGRDMLLKWQESEHMLNPNAISAMPSLHVAVSWLAALYAFGFKKSTGIAGIIFTLLIMAGSIYSGLHYAVDGYVSIAVVSLFWWLAGKFPVCRAPNGGRSLMQ